MSRQGATFVYFARLISGDGPIKIGCSLAPQRRVEDLMLWSPYPLELVATMPGGYDLEQRWHRRFAAHHSHHEWFHPSPDLIVAITAVKSGCFRDEMLHVPPGTRSIHYRPENGEWISNRAAIRRLAKAGLAIPSHITAALDDYWRASDAEKAQRQRLVAEFVALNDRRAA